VSGEFGKDIVTKWIYGGGMISRTHLAVLEYLR
jgi:hypothetical protein